MGKLRVVLLAGCLGTLSAQESSYREPNFNQPLFEESAWKAPLEQKEEARDLMLAVAELSGLDPLIKAKALAFAFTLWPGDSDVIYANHLQRYGLPRPMLAPPAFAVREAELGRRLDALRIATQEFDETEEGLAGRFLQDIANDLGAGNAAEAVRVDDWSKALPWIEMAALKKEALSGATEAVPSMLESDGDFGREESKLAGVFLTTEGVQVSKVDNRIEQLWLLVEEAMAETGVKASATSMGGASDQGRIQIGGDIPGELASALHEVEKMFLLRELAFPRGKGVSITFEKGYSPADGPTAALTCALLVDSLVSGDELDPQVALAGDLNADGSVQPVYEIGARLRVAAGKCRILAIPKSSQAEVGDLVLSEGVKPLLGVQVFTVESFDEAKALAQASRKAEISESLKTFGEVQKALNRPRPETYLTNPQVQQRLKHVLELTPNHLSARLLLLRGLNRHPKSLSLGGSLDEVQHCAIFVDGGRSPRFGHQGEAMNHLAKFRNRLHPKTSGWVDALMDYGSLDRRFGSGGVPSREREAARQRITLEYQKLMADPEARELLMR